MQKSKVENVLGEIDILIYEARRIPLSDYIVIDCREISSLIDDLKDAIPSEIRESRQLLQERERIIENAKAEAKSIVDLATAERDRLISEHNVTRMANEQAADIIRAAQQEERTLRSNAMAYADDIFNYISARTDEMVGIIQKVHETVQQAHQSLHEERLRDG
ncbi:MAG: hypothetical protein N3A57_01175 [Negativicutes bacterium]|nr:hypothetical protein [Negativicutes bacterium]